MALVGTTVSELRLVSQREIMSYHVIFSAFSRVIRSKSLVAKEFRFQLQKDRNPVEKSSLDIGPGFGWISLLRRSRIVSQVAVSSKGR